VRRSHRPRKAPARAPTRPGQPPRQRQPAGDLEKTAGAPPCRRLFGRDPSGPRPRPGKTLAPARRLRLPRGRRVRMSESGLEGRRAHAR
jgi:hypothetical protein